MILQTNVPTPKIGSYFYSHSKRTRYENLPYLIALTTFQCIHAQILHQSYNKENGYTYLFSLDQYQQPLNYAIEVSQLGGNSTKLKGNYKGNKGSGNLIKEPA